METLSLTFEDIQEELQRAQQDRYAFSKRDERAKHLRLFFAWLAPVLHDAPGIHWDQLPSQVMGHLVRTVGDHPDAVSIALAVGCAMPAMKRQTLLHISSTLLSLFRRLRAYGMSTLSQLRDRELWTRFVTGRQLSAGEVRMLTVYASLAFTHERIYLESLHERQRLVLEPYALPPLPARFLERYAQHRATTIAAAERRKEQSDVLTPLLPLLVELVQFRKQAAERLYKAFCTYCDQARAGTLALPYRFQHTDRSFSVTEDAPSIAAVSLSERTVTLSLTLWNRTSWVEAHPELYGRCSQWQRKRRLFAYATEKDLYFLQYEGPCEDLLWCGDVLTSWPVLTTPSTPSSETEEAPTKPWHTVLHLTRPGLLAPPKRSSVWFRHAMSSGAVLFEPESLYRGTLYAAALATLALTNGSRVSELLQVSATRFETIVVDEIKQQQPTGRKIGLLVQKLLPKGYTQESERQLFLIGEMAGRLLREIGQLLEAAHDGIIPVVQPTRSAKEEDLAPEPYLFQWAASADGRLGLLSDEDVARLLRFLFHGLTLTTRTGKPIRIVPHLLRHVLATHARTVQNVPAEAVAYLLHHRVTLSGSAHALTLPEATAYYSRMPTAQLLALLFDAQSTCTWSPERSYLQAPSPRTLEQMDEALRQIFEQWSLIGPTVLGFCSAGLCVRPDNRALCLGCRFLVPHYSNLSRAIIWRKLYLLHAEQHEAHGHPLDAKQARQMVQYLDDIITIMQIQIKARQDGGYLPFADILLTDSGKEEKEDDRTTHP